MGQRSQFKPQHLGQLGCATPACRTSESEQCCAWAFLKTASPKMATPMSSRDWLRLLTPSAYNFSRKYGNSYSDSPCQSGLLLCLTSPDDTNLPTPSQFTLMLSLTQQSSPEGDYLGSLPNPSSRHHFFHLGIFQYPEHWTLREVGSFLSFSFLSRKRYHIWMSNVSIPYLRTSKWEKKISTKQARIAA